MAGDGICVNGESANEKNGHIFMFEETVEPNAQATRVFVVSLFTQCKSICSNATVTWTEYLVRNRFIHLVCHHFVGTPSRSIEHPIYMLVRHTIDICIQKYKPHISTRYANEHHNGLCLFVYLPRVCSYVREIWRNAMCVHLSFSFI